MLVSSCGGSPTQTELPTVRTQDFVLDTTRIPDMDPAERASFRNAYAISSSPVVVRDAMGRTAYAWTSLDINIKDSSERGNNHCYMYANVWLTYQNDPKSTDRPLVAWVKAKLDTEDFWVEGIAGQAKAVFEIESVNGCPLSQCALGRFRNGRDSNGQDLWLDSDPVCLKTPL